MFANLNEKSEQILFVVQVLVNNIVFIHPFYQMLKIFPVGQFYSNDSWPRFTIIFFFDKKNE